MDILDSSKFINENRDLLCLKGVFLPFSGKRLSLRKEKIIVGGRFVEGLSVKDEGY